MLFTGYVFWVFFVVTLGLLALNQIFIRNVRFQNCTLLLGSYVFYGYWDWKFLSLIIVCTLQTYYLTSRMRVEVNSPAGPNDKKLLWASVAINLSILAYFKYMNFFYSEIVHVLAQFGYTGSTSTLEIILPVGISFYIFQSLTYVIDVYRGEIKKEPSIVNYATYIAFFPQLVAGPIERARNLLPQFKKISVMSTTGFVQGIRLIIFGLFLKVAIADSLAPLVDEIFRQPESFNGGVLILGAVYFAAQIYGDFCGYSMIAIGVASCMGFRLMTNFATPYLAVSIQEFWRRWHISLSSFFRDYVYIPLGGSRVAETKISRNLLVTFTTSGVWHGANWTFLIWGFLHGFSSLVERFFGKDVWSTHEYFPRVRTALSWCLTMIIVGHLWIFFRAESLGDAVVYIEQIYLGFDMPDVNRRGVIYVFYMIIVDAILYKNNRLENPISRFGIIDSLVFAIMIVLVSDAFIVNSSQSFIYFQF